MARASVRGLQEREISNDKGFSANAEFQTPNLCARFPAGTTRCNALAFVDGGTCLAQSSAGG